MKLRSLSELKRPQPGEIVLARLPQHVMITNYAYQRALAVNDLVRRIHGGSYEWYGFTLGGKDYPECINDIGLPVNDRNIHQYTGIGPENIALFQDSLAPDTIINGWIHSHGSNNFTVFSRTDHANHVTVLDYVGTYLKKPVSRREVFIDDLQLVSEEGLEGGEIGLGSVWIVTDAPVARAKIFEVVYGSFCYGLLVGDGGWHRQDIYYRTRTILTGATSITRRESEMLPVDSGRVFTTKDRDALAVEVKEKIRPEKRTDAVFADFSGTHGEASP